MAQAIPDQKTHFSVIRMSNAIQKWQRSKVCTSCTTRRRTCTSSIDAEHRAHERSSSARPRAHSPPHCSKPIDSAVARGLEPEIPTATGTIAARVGVLPSPSRGNQSRRRHHEQFAIHIDVPVPVVQPADAVDQFLMRFRVELWTFMIFQIAASSVH